MATAANPPPGAVPANGAGDPFVGPGSGALRYASFDTDQFSLYASHSPSHTKRALEAHLKDTDRRIQDASRLGTTLIQQRKELSARLKEVEQVEQSDEVPADLRKKLAELEREYNDIGRESARAFLPKRSSMDGTPNVLSGQARDSPSKVSAPSRRHQRNQPSNRVHDIEFATEISTSLLAQVRQLQSALAEKDEALRDATTEKEQLKAEAAGMVQRIKHMDESEQHYKDENWNLEMKIQELEGANRELSDKHDRLTQTLKATESEKMAAQRELDELRVSHDKLNEDHALVKRQQETDIHSLRRDIASHQIERITLQKKIDELNSQNTELARAVSYRLNHANHGTESEFVSAAEDQDDDEYIADPSEPSSPIKGTPRHGMLESETLKSSLNHAHRMIQNLKNNIHREKTEKIELRRMLLEARDELEIRRNDPTLRLNAAKQRKAESDTNRFKKPARLDRLGANRSSTTEILDDDEPDWEDHEVERTPSKSRFDTVTSTSAPAAAGIARFDHATFGGAEPESTDAFETATERENTAETEAFETGHEDLSGDEGELTETESGINRPSTGHRKSVSPLATRGAGDRRSFQSTASTSADEADEIRTPVRDQGPKYRIRLNRGNRRSGHAGELITDSPHEPSPGLMSPTSSNGTPQPAGQSLGDELDAVDEEESVDGEPIHDEFGDYLHDIPESERHGSVEPQTPVKGDSQGREAGAGEDDDAEDHELDISDPTIAPDSPKPTGEEAVLAHQANAAMLAHEFAIKKNNYVDAGIMTEPWEPEREVIVQKQTLRDRAGEVVGGALAGFGLGKLRRSRGADDNEPAEAGAGHEDDVAPKPEQEAAAAALPDEEPANAHEPGADHVQPSSAEADELQPVLDDDDQTRPLTMVRTAEHVPREPPSAPLDHSAIITQETEPIEPPRPKADEVRREPAMQFQQSAIVTQETKPVSPPPAPVAQRPIEPSVIAKDAQVERRAADPDVPLEAAAPLAVQAAEKVPEQELNFSEIEAQDFEPLTLTKSNSSSLQRKKSFRQLGAMYAAEESQPALPEANLPKEGSRPVPVAEDEEADRALIEPKVFGGVRKGARGIATLIFGGDEDDGTETHIPLREPPEDAEGISKPEPLHVKKPVADEGSQTIVSGNEIEDMLRNKIRTTSFTDVGVLPFKIGGSPGSRRSIDGAMNMDAARQPRRPASAGSIRNKGGAGVPPPLPEDYTQKITAAQKGPGPSSSSSAGTMGPPLMPASAYRSSRPKTPAERANERSVSRDGTTPKPVRSRDSRTHMQVPKDVSRRTSVSSFASELDERFNITRGDLIYPSDIPPATDPRMIQAITQTMIGEYLWKYTRKAGRSETSTTRHRRFFWVHPYTRTLYWSEQDPSTAGRSMLKAKSVAIQAVRVITDDNAYPPGLHRKSLVVVTPGREIVFTAPTGQRHETWFNALSYLLLRTEQEKNEAEDQFGQEDVDEFHPSNGGGFSFRRSISRMTGRDRSQSRSRMSLSSYNSRTTRTSSPQRKDAVGGGSLAQRQSAAANRAQAVISPAPPSVETTTSRTGTVLHGTTSGGRFSSLTSRFRPGSSQGGTARGSFSSARHGRLSMNGRQSLGVPGAGDPGEIYDADVANDSAEDLRAVIERQERDADRLENVRACCDGEYYQMSFVGEVLV
jgi:hypothetical protein